MPLLDDEGNTLTGSSDSSEGTGGAEVESFDISGFPFQFNPPLHQSLRFARTDLGEGAKTSGVAAFYDETRNKYGSDLATRRDEAPTGFEKLRLGRIIMDDIAVSKGVKDGGVRFGFRFLYNPSQLGGALNVGTDFIPDQRATNTAVLQKGLENMHLEVLLNRIPDVTGNAGVTDYLPNITEDDRKRIQEQGTQYDLDFLYRCANGIHNTRQRSQTGDIGVLLPNPCRLIIGPYTSRGAVVSVQVSDQMFSGSMVPTLSYVNITFARFLNMSQDDLADLQSLGITQEGSSGNDDGGSSGSSDGGTSSDGGAGASNPGSGAPNKKNRPKYPINFQGVRGTSSYGHDLHAAVCSAFPWQDKSGGFSDYSAGNSNHGTGRALDIMMPVQPKTGANRGWGIANFLKSRSSDLHVTQVIYQQKIWTSTRRGEGWRAMGNRGSDTANHYDHVHVSFGPGSGNDDRSRKLTLYTGDEYWR